MKILEAISKELSHIPQDINLSLKYTSNFPISDETNSFHTTYINGRAIDKYWISWNDDIGAWVKCDGSQVEVVVREAAKAVEVSGVLTIGFTSILTGACLNLQNRVAIHANSVAIGGKAVAFVGYSGMGKSTLSTYCASRGAGFVTDDVLVVDKQGFAHPGNPRIKLYPHTATSLGLQTPEHTEYKVFYQPESLGAKLLDKPVPMGIIYLLAESEDDSIYTEQLNASKAVFDLLTHSYYAHALITSKPGLFDTYSRLVKQAAVKRLFYPRNFQKLPQVYDFLQQEVATLNTACR